MKIYFTKMMLVLAIVISFSVQTMAQTVIWSEDFSIGEIPTTWTNVDAASQTSDLWKYDTTASYFGTQPVFSAPSAGDGFAIFDSDAAGALTSSHDMQLTTEAINCSGLSTVVVKFYNQYGYYSQGGVSIAELGVSTDGTNFTYYPILTTVIRDDLSDSEQLEEVDVSATAANQTTVYLQFRWRGNYEYDWKIDDITVQDGLTPLPPNDITIASEWYAIASSYIYPTDQIDSIRFMADVANIGANAPNNVTLEVEVVRDSDNSIVHTQSYNYGTLQSGDTVENYLFPTHYLPPATPESYTVTYTLTSDATSDATPSNNTASFSFEVVDGVFDKAPAANVFVAPSASDNWTVGTHYYAYQGSEINGIDTTARYVNAVTFGISDANGNGEIAGQSAEVFVEKGYDVDGNGIIEQSERTLVALGSHTFTTSDYNNFITVPVANYVGLTPLYELEDNTHYLVTVKYTALTTDAMFLLMSDVQDYRAANYAADASGVVRYDYLLDVGNTTDYDYSVNFQGDPTPVVGMLTSTVVTTSSKDVLLASNTLSLFPNPAKEFIKATIDLEQTAQRVSVTIYNIQGQVMETRNLSNVRKEQIEFDLDQYTNGTYLMSIDTEFGHTIQRFVVNK